MDFLHLIESEAYSPTNLKQVDKSYYDGILFAADQAESFLANVYDVDESSTFIDKIKSEVAHEAISDFVHWLESLAAEFAVCIQDEYDEEDATDAE